MKGVSSPAEQRVVLERVSWSTYAALLHDLDERRGRMAYDRGLLEIMSPSILHESARRLIGRLIEAATEELGIDILSAGALTLKRQDLQRGIEPDECYYVAHAAAVRGKDEVDLAVDPPPDLAIEVDITRSSLQKLAIYAALGVPELWRYDGERLAVYVADAAGGYREAPASRVLPHVPVAEIAALLERRGAASETELVRELRASLRARRAGPDARG